MAIRGFEKKDPYADFNQLLKLAQYGDALEKNEIRNANSEAVFLQNRLKNVNNIEELNNLIPTIESHNKKVENSGLEKYSINYKEKELIYKKANISYNSAKDILNENLGSPEDLTKKLLSGGWEGYTEGILNIENLLDSIEEADEYGFRFKPEGNYTEKSLKKALDDRKKSHEAAFEVFDQYQGSFEIVNEDGSMDDASRMLIDRLKFSIAIGDRQEVASTISTGTTRAINGYEKYAKHYVKLNELQLKAKAKTANEIAEEDDEFAAEFLAMIDATGRDRNKPLDPAWISDMKTQAHQNAKNFNLQHKVFNGVLYDDNPIWKRQGIDEDDWDKMGLVGGTSLNDLNKDNLDPLTKEILDTSELSKENIAKLKGEEIKDVSPVEKAPMSLKEPQVGDVKDKEKKIDTSPKFLPVDKGAFNESFKKILKIDNIEKHIAKNIPDKYKGKDYEGGYPWYISDELNKLKTIINRFKSGKSTGGSARIAAVKKYNKILEFSENLK